MYLKFILYSIVSLFFVSCSDFWERLELPSVFSDNMILQRETDVYIWGKSYPKTNVEVISSWGKKSITTSDLNGKITEWHIDKECWDKKGVECECGPSWWDNCEEHQ